MSGLCGSVCLLGTGDTSNLVAWYKLLRHATGVDIKCDSALDIFLDEEKPQRTRKKSLVWYKCQACSYTSDTKSRLARHEMTHTGERPFKCRFCEYAAAQKCTLQIHERTHMGDKPLVCDFCGYATGDPSTMRVHRRIHTGEKPYKCKQCSYAAASSRYLRDHERVHEKHKLFF